MKQKILQAVNLKYSIKKGMFSVLGKMNLFGSGKGGSPLPFRPLGYTSKLQHEIRPKHCLFMDIVLKYFYWT